MLGWKIFVKKKPEKQEKHRQRGREDVCEGERFSSVHHDAAVAAMLEYLPFGGVCG